MIARYHLDCRTSFITERAVKSAATASSSGTSCQDEAFEQVVKTMEIDKSRIWNSVEVSDMYNSLEDGNNNRLKEHFGEELVILSAAGFANVLIFRSKAPNVIKFVTDQEGDSTDTAVSVVAKQIIREVKAIKVDKFKYDIRLTEETLTEPLSETFMSLLSRISPKLNGSNPAYMIGNVVSRYVRQYPTTLQIALGVLVRDSRALIQQLNELGVTCLYDEVLQFKKSAAVAATEDI